MRWRNLSISVLCGLLTLALILVSGSLVVPGVTVDAAGNTPTSQPTTGLIVFTINKGKASNIYLMNPDGSGVSQLTFGTATNNSPVWSPDGKQIVYVSDRDGNLELYTMNADGSNSTRLTDNEANDGTPAWSPDGKQIAFSSDRDDALDIFVIDADGSNPIRLTNNSTSKADKTPVSVFPAWSPDGKQVAFASNADGKAELYLVDSDGSNLTKIANQRGNNVTPAWSPDGKQIAFVSDRNSNKQLQLFVMDIDGKNITLLTKTSANVSFPSWSPDSKQIVFVSESNNTSEVDVIGRDGRNQKRVSKSGTVASYPNWSVTAPSIKLPFVSPAAAAACPMATDSTYGYSADNPIPVGGGDFGGPARERDYLDQLRGPKGEKITYTRTGSFPSASDASVILDEYRITYSGLKKPILLYLNEYSDDPPKIPVGFTCAS